MLRKLAQTKITRDRLPWINLHQGIVRLRVDVCWMTMFCSSTSPRCGSVEVPREFQVMNNFLSSMGTKYFVLIDLAKLEY
ncbi:hypothetical protein Peur_025621 [Populus x canadensis]